MSIYRQKYEAWFKDLNEEERKAESARMTTSKAKPKSGATKAKPIVVQAASTSQQTPVTFSVTPMTQMIGQQQPQQIIVQHPQQQIMQPQPALPARDPDKLREEILRREPVEPARSPKQLFITEWGQKHKKGKKGAEAAKQAAKEAWRGLDKKEKKKWAEKLEPQRQKYIEAYTVFVRRLDKEELELYTELKSKRDEEEEARRQTESSDSEDSESSESDSDSDSDSESD